MLGCGSFGGTMRCSPAGEEGAFQKACGDKVSALPAHQQVHLISHLWCQALWQLLAMSSQGGERIVDVGEHPPE